MKDSKRKQQILEASARVFAQKGYFAASVSDIIEEAGVARGTFYLYFAESDKYSPRSCNGLSTRWNR
jgi:AcrR family transcriptional regulator